MLISETSKNSTKLVKRGRNIARKYPIMRPFLRIPRRILFGKKKSVMPNFIGWGMTTFSELPWVDEYDGEVFRKASLDIKKTLEFDKSVVGIDTSNIDVLRWRHWNISTAVKYAIKFTDTKELHFVECGVGEGMTGGRKPDDPPPDDPHPTTLRLITPRPTNLHLTAWAMMIT